MNKGLIQRCQLGILFVYQSAPKLAMDINCGTYLFGLSNTVDATRCLGKQSWIDQRLANEDVCRLHQS